MKQRLAPLHGIELFGASSWREDECFENVMAEHISYFSVCLLRDHGEDRKMAHSLT
jgi:hypothetical protein